MGILGAMALSMASVVPASAQAPSGDRLSLICVGTDTMVMAMNPYYRWGRTSYSGGMVFGEGRAPGQLAVMVEGGKVRVRPPETSEPMFSKKSDDGWYELTDVSIDPLSIKGRLKWNKIDRSKLSIDRRNGEVTFGAFTGVCQAASANPDKPKF